MLVHSHKKRKDSLEKRAVLLIFWLALEISGVVVQRVHQNSEQKAAVSEDFLSEDEFETVLATLRCNKSDVKSSEVVEKIAKMYHKSSFYQ